MIPLKTFQGLSKESLEKLILNRKVYIWGTGVIAGDVLLSLKKSGIPVEAFLDNRKSLIGKEVEKLEVLNSEDVITYNNLSQSFIIIASSTFLKEAESKCLSMKFQKGRDFVTYLKISRQFAAIDVSGDCNIACKSCPQGNLTPLRKAGNMSLSTFKKVFGKLYKDLPSLVGIELFSWGEPFVNTELPMIVRHAQKYVPCFLSTNLQDISNLEDVILSKPYQLSISVNGCNGLYEKIMQGASWEILLKNLKALSELVVKHSSKTNIFIRYFDYSSQSREELGIFRNYCKSIGVDIKFEYTYLNSYDNYLDLLKGKVLSIEANEIFTEIPWNLKKVLYFAEKDINKPCLSQRIFPIINWDKSVSLCHTYYNPVIAKNYLTISMEELLEKRHNQEQCHECQKFGLHRLDLEVIKSKYRKDVYGIY